MLPHALKEQQTGQIVRGLPDLASKKKNASAKILLYSKKQRGNKFNILISMIIYTASQRLGKGVVNDSRMQMQMPENKLYSSKTNSQAESRSKYIQR